MHAEKLPLHRGRAPLLLTNRRNVSQYVTSDGKKLFVRFSKGWAAVSAKKEAKYAESAFTFIDTSVGSHSYVPS